MPRLILTDTLLEVSSLAGVLECISNVIVVVRSIALALGLGGYGILMKVHAYIVQVVKF